MVRPISFPLHTSRAWYLFLQEPLYPFLFLTSTSDMSSAKYSKLSVTEQPQAIAWTPEPKEAGLQALKEYMVQRGATTGATGHSSTCSCSEKQEQHDQQEGLTQHSDHRRCHNGRLRRFLLPAVAFFLFLMALMAVGCMSMGADAGWSVSDLVSRAVGDGTTNNGNSPFVHRKCAFHLQFIRLM